MNQPTPDNKQNPYAYSGGKQADAVKNDLRRHPHTRFGVASTICGVLTWGLFAAMVAVVLFDMQSDELYEDKGFGFTRVVIVVGLMALSIFTLSAMGALLGTIGALRSNLDRRKLFAFVGLCLNLPHFLFFLASILFGFG